MGTALGIVPELPSELGGCYLCRGSRCSRQVQCVSSSCLGAPAGQSRLCLAIFLAILCVKQAVLVNIVFASMQFLSVCCHTANPSSIGLAVCAGNFNTFVSR